ncbi:MAG: hypothetical protein DRJ33_04635 [Candidatus Methanomethylicota archaeon]|uniref:Uncharacterized protein n=1 Tax=Thermoproteota archaeon TaxID=2056631 RepID=A0A497EYC0_9CREN|nr:MAG: hypothetical protein DRJ33_04635 [Candidatus Verstraetearchaeota archaeon]
MSSREVYVWFIDANVLAHWILGKGVLEKLYDLIGLDKVLLDIYLERYRSSLDFVDEVLRLRDKEEFYVSSLAVNEIFAAIKDEICAAMLFARGIPISQWRDPRVIPSIDERLAEQIYYEVLKLFDVLFSGNIRIVEELSATQRQYFEVLGSIILMLDVRTHDAMLLTNAILHGADYFVTTDKRLVDKVGPIVQDKYSLRIIDPQRALNILKRKR